MATASPKAIYDGLIPFAGDRPPSDPLRITLLNMAYNHFSSYANWRWLTSAGSEIALSDTQTYDWDTDFEVLKVPFIYLVNKSGQISILTPVSSVPVSNAGQSTMPTMFEFIPQDNDGGQVVLWPKPPSAVQGKIIPIQKKQHVLVDADNLSTAGTLEHPDAYNHIFEFFLLDLMYMWAQTGPQTAVTVGQAKNTGVSGALARAYSAADKIVATEALFIDPSKGPFLA